MVVEEAGEFKEEASDGMTVDEEGGNEVVEACENCFGFTPIFDGGLP